MTSISILYIIFAIVSLLGLAMWLIRWATNRQTKALVDEGVATATPRHVMNVATATPCRQVRSQDSKLKHPLAKGGKRKRDRMGNFSPMIAA